MKKQTVAVITMLVFFLAISSPTFAQCTATNHTAHAGAISGGGSGAAAGAAAGTWAGFALCAALSTTIVITSGVSAPGVALTCAPFLGGGGALGVFFGSIFGTGLGAKIGEKIGNIIDGNECNNNYTVKNKHKVAEK